jgi:hypothetical protein
MWSNGVGFREKLLPWVLTSVTLCSEECVWVCWLVSPFAVVAAHGPGLSGADGDAFGRLDVLSLDGQAWVWALLCRLSPPPSPSPLTPYPFSYPCLLPHTSLTTSPLPTPSTSTFLVGMCIPALRGACLGILLFPFSVAL